MSNVDRFKSIIDEMFDTYKKKNKDYKGSFEESVSEFGPIAGIVRLSDKFNRLKNLLGENEIPVVKDESVLDTLTDMACYAIMLRMEVEKNSMSKEELNLMENKNSVFSATDRELKPGNYIIEKSGYVSTYKP